MWTLEKLEVFYNQLRSFMMTTEDILPLITAAKKEMDAQQTSLTKEAK